MFVDRTTGDTGLITRDKNGGLVKRGMVSYVYGLTPNTTDLDVAQRNTRVLQKYLNESGKIIIPSNIGDVYFAPIESSIDYGMLLMSNDTYIDVSIGTNLTHLPSPTVTRPVFCNKDAQGNKMAVTSIVVTGMDAQGKYSIVNATVPNNNFVAGEYILFKGDTTGFYNRVWKVQYVNGDIVTFHAMSYLQYPNGAGTIIAYKANANITIAGEGSIGGAYNLTNGTIGYVNLCMVLFNKVKSCSYRIRSTRSYQRGCQFVNFYECAAGGTSSNPISIESATVGVQVTGPGSGISISDIYGGNSDDKVAILTDDVTGAQFYDADGTLNSGGAIDSVTIDNIFDHGNSTRTVMLGADGHRFDNLTVSRIHRKHRGQGQGIEMEVLNGGTFGKTNLIDVELMCHGKGGTLLGLTGATTNTNGGGTYESIELVRPVIRAAVGGGLLGACETNLINCASNNWGTVKNVRIESPSIVYDLQNSSNETILITGGDTAKWTWEKVEIVSPDITTTGTNGRVALFAVGIGNDLEFSMFGGRVKTRSSYGLFISSGRRYTVNIMNTPITGMNDLISGNGQVDLNVINTNLSGMWTSQDGALVRTYGNGTSGARLTHNIYTSGVKFGNTFITGGLGTYTDVQYRSGGGNSTTQVTPFYNGVNNDGGASNNNAYYLNGDCSDIPVRLDKIARNAGAIAKVYTGIGTIVAGNLAVCDATGTTNSWKQMTNTTLVY